jgi:hypothetical protein
MMIGRNLASNVPTVPGPNIATLAVGLIPRLLPIIIQVAVPGPA